MKAKKPATRKRRAVAKMKHAKVRLGQKLSIHVLGARGKEVSCQVVETNTEGGIQFAPAPPADGAETTTAPV